jgi:hypothetical protein
VDGTVTVGESAGLRKLPDTGIGITDEQPFEGCVFRVVEMENGCCRNSLWCRVELIPAGGYGLSFYHGRGRDDALHARDPMVVVPVHLAGLAAEAYKRLQEMQTARDKAQLAAFRGPQF